MSEIRVEKYQSSHESLWNAFIAEAKNATFLFSRSFMDYHSDRFEDYSLLIFRKDKLVSVLPANRKDNIIYSHQGLSYGGFVFHQKTRFEVIFEVVRASLMFCENNGLSFLEYKMLPNIYNLSPSDEVDYILFLLNAERTRSDLSMTVDLLTDRNYARDRKAGIRRGEESKLIVKKEAVFDAFWNELLIPKLQSKHNTTPVHQLDEIKLLASRFPDNISQFNVYQNDKLVAGTTIFETKKVAHSQYIASNDEKNQLGSLDFLHDYLIQYYQHQGKSFFDFGISNENQGRNLNQGLLYWKEGFSAQGVVHEFYRIPVKNVKYLNDVFI